MNEKRLIQNFLEFVQIDSETKNEKQFMEHLKSYFTRLGLRVEEDSVGKLVDSNANNLFIHIPGNDLEPVVLSAHMDTVKPGNGIIPIIKGDKIVSQGDTILGGDDKAGIAVIIEAVESILENKEPHRPIDIALTIYEEGGLNGARYNDTSKFNAKNVLVFDTGGPLENIVNQSVSQYSFKAEVIGLAAHAGAEPEKGISALSIAAEAISNMNLGRIDFETTANFGIISGGEGTNVVMPNLHLKGEARSHNEDKLKIQVDHMKEQLELAAKKFGGCVNFRIKKEYSSFYTDPNSSFAVEISNVLEQMNLKPNFIKTGGGSDANMYAPEGLNPLIISVGMSEVHTVKESLDLPIFKSAATFLYQYLKGDYHG